MFPLRGAILLPRATLPLNVFEPRYLEMLDDVMSGDRLIGIIQPAAGRELTTTRRARSADSVGLRSVGCVGRVTTYQEVDDARLVITLTGITRYEILDEAVTDLPYRVASVSYDRFASDLNEGLGEDQVDRTNLLRVLRSYLDANKLEADWARDPARLQRVPHQRAVRHVPLRAGGEAGAARGRGSEAPRRRARRARRDGARLQRRQRQHAAVDEQEMTS